MPRSTFFFFVCCATALKGMMGLGLQDATAVIKANYRVPDAKQFLIKMKIG